MSGAGLMMAINDNSLTGYLRLASFSIGDCSGRVYIPGIMNWCNCSKHEAELYVADLLLLGYLEQTVDGLVNRAMMGSSYEAYDAIHKQCRQIAVPGRVRMQVYERDGHKCHYCQSGDNLTLDHVIPRSAKGDNSPDNLVTCCKYCNSSKGAKSYSDFIIWRKENRMASTHG